MMVEWRWCEMYSITETTNIDGHHRHRRSHGRRRLHSRRRRHHRRRRDRCRRRPAVVIIVVAAAVAVIVTVIVIVCVIYKLKSIKSSPFVFFLAFHPRRKRNMIQVFIEVG